MKLYEDGLCKSIGVSNFSIEQLEALKDISDLSPAVNQIRFNPWDYKQNIVDYCKQEGIKVVADSP